MHNLRIIPVIYAEFKHGYQGFYAYLRRISSIYAWFTHDTGYLRIIYAGIRILRRIYADFTQD